MDFDSLQNLLPIIIFVLWLIFGQRKKKKAESSRGPAPQRPAAPAPSQERRPDTPYASAKKTLDDFLEEMGVVIRQDRPQTPSQAPAARPPREEPRKPARMAAPSVRRGAALKPASGREHLETETNESFHDERRPARTVTSGHAGSYITRPVSSEKKITPPASFEDLRKAVVWSEIIGPPVSIRDE